MTDAEWEFLAPYLILMREDAPRRRHSLRELLNGPRYAAKIGCDWRSLPDDLPPWHAVYQQALRWRKADCFEAARDLRELLRLKEGRLAKPSAAVLDSRTLQSTAESGHRAGYDGAKRRKGSKVHLAVDTLGCFLALLVTPADENDRSAVGELAGRVQESTGESVGLAGATRAIPGRRPPRPPASTGSNSRSSSSPRPERALC